MIRIALIAALIASHVTPANALGRQLIIDIRSGVVTIVGVTASGSDDDVPHDPVARGARHVEGAARHNARIPAERKAPVLRDSASGDRPTLKSVDMKGAVQRREKAVSQATSTLRKQSASDRSTVENIK